MQSPAVSPEGLRWIIEIASFVVTVLIGIFHIGGRIKCIETKLDMLISICPKMHIMGPAPARFVQAECNED
jgi:hypothetical protein